MAITSNYLTLQQQIADELGDRQDLLIKLSDSPLALSPIQNAIQSAVAKWEREPFYFNRIRLAGAPGGPFNLVPGQEYYGAQDYAPIGTLAVIDKLWILVSGNRYTLTRRTPEYLDDISVRPDNTGLPVDYALDAGQVRFYSIPDQAYPVGLRGTQRLTPLAEPADANAWTSDAFDLIRCEAKLILGRDVLNEPDTETAASKAIYGNPAIPSDRGYLAVLKAETNRASGPARVRPTAF